MDTRSILERLVAFDTVSHASNLDLIAWVQDLLQIAGAETVLVPDPHAPKANLYATIGPRDRPGVMLSGHTDVVPAEDQAWTRPPFWLTEDEGRLYGRGTADMKGFIACAIAASLALSTRRLRTPLHLAFSYDEEIGCLGVRSLIDLLASAPVRPAICIVGEPTEMAVATGHKGKRGLRAHCRGREGHSALAPLAMNALHLGADLVQALRALQARIEARGPRDGDYGIPYTTVHVARIRGGTALNIVPNACTVDFEIRHLAEDDPDALISEIKAAASGIVRATGDPDAAIEISEVLRYPGLGTAPDADVVGFVKSLTGGNGTIKVAFGTEGGLFAENLGIPTVVCGPGSMAQGHKPDEFVTFDQIARCDAMMRALGDRLVAGL